MKSFEIKRILVPVDFSAASLNALDHAVSMAKMKDAEIILIHVVEGLFANSNPDYLGIAGSIGYENDIMSQSRLNLEELAENLRRKGILKITTLSEIGHTHKQIIKISEEMNIDIIVMGSHCVSGFNEFISGSRVVNNAKCPVLSIQDKIKTTGFKNVFVPFNDEPHAREGVRYAIKIAEMYNSSMTILGIDIENDESHIKKLQLEAAQIKRIAEARKVNCTAQVISEGFFADLLLNHAREMNADLIVEVAGLEKLSIVEYFLGSFEKRIISHSPVPVLSIKATFNTDTVDMRFY